MESNKKETEKLSYLVSAFFTILFGPLGSFYSGWAMIVIMGGLIIIQGNEVFLIFGALIGLPIENPNMRIGEFIHDLEVMAVYWALCTPFGWMQVYFYNRGWAIDN